MLKPNIIGNKKPTSIDDEKEANFKMLKNLTMADRFGVDKHLIERHQVTFEWKSNETGRTTKEVTLSNKMVLRISWPDDSKIFQINMATKISIQNLENLLNFVNDKGYEDLQDLSKA